MREFNQEEQKNICQLYNEQNKSIVAISQIYHCRKEAIKNVLVINNIEIVRNKGNRRIESLPDEEEKLICELYEEGKSISYIANITHHHNPVIEKILQKHGYTLEIRKGRQKIVFSEEQKDKIIEMNSKHYSYVEIGKELNCCGDIIRKFLRENGIEKTSHRMVNHNLDDNYFSEIDTEEKAYFLGLLKTDGFIKKGNVVGISLKEEDKYMIEKFKSALNADSVITFDNRENKHCYSIEITSEKICSDLSNYDIVRNKTYSLTDIKLGQIPLNLQRHYLRGLLDGDGSVFKDGPSIGISFCGYNEEFVRSFQLAIDNYLNKENHNVISKSNAFQCKWKGNIISKKILTYLYEDSTIYLERKKKFYDLLK